MDYKQTVKYLYSLNLFGSKMGLERERKLLSLLGSPPNDLRCILVGGTCGKGSTVAMISSILKEAGFKVGRFTKPHLISINERFSINGRDINNKYLVRIITKIKFIIDIERRKGTWKKIGDPSFFEIVVATAFLYFKQEKVDFAVFEVGLGGRLDATNLCNPLVSVITNVGIEHTKILGKTIEKIAFEKAGIIRRNGILVTSAKGKALRVFKSICKKRNSKIIEVKKSKYPVALTGEHQLMNASCAAEAIGALSVHGIKVSEKTIRKGLKNVIWPGRFEVMGKKPVLILDCAKDADAMAALRKSMFEKYKGKRTVLVISISSDKDVEKMLKQAAPIANKVIVTKHSLRERAIKPEILGKKAKKFFKEVFIIPNVKKALEHGMNIVGKNGVVLVTGSVFLVGDARSIIFGKKHSNLLNELSI
ncbi:bifunctional folylpolyglutamate synthase/dihydrofolate synthase [Candidatus Micrarchaeota archaeon]|nr:bifunctional folylpolyglutamate synthase/dihydrofolate synthase [Candidatus Micrarchaeota archaeon]